MKDALAVVYKEHGKPTEVLAVEPRPVAEPGAGEALLALRCAVIHPSDMGMIAGSYGRLKELPAVAGREGVAEIVAVGEGVDKALVGRRVRMPEEPGVWMESTVVEADSLEFFPEGLADELAAQAYVNPPTAYRVMKDFVDLKPGDWIIQNAGNSAVGFCVAGIAKSMGVNCLCVVRDVETWEKPLMEAGAAAVVAEDSGYEKQIKDITGGTLPKLGLNSIGGNSVMSIIKCMAESGVVVTFGGMVGDKVRFPTRELIFKDISLRGFWMDRWFRNASDADKKALMDEVCRLLQEGVMQLPVDGRFNLKDGLKAVERAFESRKGKVLLASNWKLT